MFKKSHPENDNAFDSLIGSSTSIEGVLRAKGTIRIDGELNGNIIVEGDVYLGESSHIVGDIEASNVFVSGRVNGNISATGTLRLTSSAKLLGDISVTTFIVDENAIFEGQSKMGGAAKVQSFPSEHERQAV